MSPKARRDNIIAIASGKGGVGKTWLSIMLAHLFARAGRKVLLFDGDIGLANVDVQLGLTPERDLSDVFRKGSKLSEVITHFPEGGFDIVAGRSGSINLAGMPISRFEPVRQQLLGLADQYDFILLDLGAGIEQHVKFLSALASKCIVVVNDEPTSLIDAYAYIKLCLAETQRPDIRLVVNQVQTQKEGDATYAILNKACENFLKISVPCLGVIRKDNKVRDSIRAQQSLISRAPSTLAATDVAALSVKLLLKE